MIPRTVEGALETIQRAMSFGYKCFYTCWDAWEGGDDWYCELFERIREKELKLSFVYGAWHLPSRKLIDAVADGCEYALFEMSPETAS